MENFLFASADKECIIQAKTLVNRIISGRQVNIVSSDSVETKRPTRKAIHISKFLLNT